MNKDNRRTIHYLCRLVGISRQYYYRSFWIISGKQSTADKVISLVCDIRCLMPRIGTRKLYYMLEHSLHELHVGRDKLFKPRLRIRKSHRRCKYLSFHPKTIKPLPSFLM